jgi:hypothetical protein
VCLGDSISGLVLVSQVAELFKENRLAVEQIDDVVQTIGYTNQVGSEFTAGWIIDMDSGEQLLRIWVVEEQIIEDSSGNGDLAGSEGRCPDPLPDVLDLSSILSRAAVIGGSEGACCEGDDQKATEQHLDKSVLNCTVCDVQ